MRKGQKTTRALRLPHHHPLSRSAMHQCERQCLKLNKIRQWQQYNERKCICTFYGGRCHLQMALLKSHSRLRLNGSMDSNRRLPCPDCQKKPSKTSIKMHGPVLCHDTQWNYWKGPETSNNISKTGCKALQKCPHQPYLIKRIAGGPRNSQQ